MAKILYKKVLLDFNKPAVINVILHQGIDIGDLTNVIVYFGVNNIDHINREYTTGQDNQVLLTSFNFEVTNISEENSLEIYFEFKDGTVSNYETLLTFEKGVVLSEDNFTIKRNKIFFICADPSYTTSVESSIEFSNSEIITVQETIIYDTKLYYKCRARTTGDTLIKIFKSDPEIDNGKPYLNKIIAVTVRE